MMRFTILFLLIFNLFSTFAVNKAIVKANVLRGESFVTADTSPKDVESIISQTLKVKRYEVLEEALPDEQVFYIDLFVFQFAADYPTVALTVRTKKGIHFVDKERVALFGDRKVASLKLAAKLAERLPDSIDTNQIYNLNLESIVGQYRISLTGLTAKAMIESYTSKYFSSINSSDDFISNFIFHNEFEKYVIYASDYQGFRRKLKGKEITLKMKINRGGKFELVDIDAPFTLSKKQKAKIDEFVNSFPLWIVDKPIDNIEFKIGTK